ncbi:SMI1/KNR4 family protein [Streptomyces sp. NPDC056638]|uniref:SMI1/KNR4 family protein n=1 Tax=Streptomyces sp. NPDC056638 TaxID=3345887 RepID=UPI0036CCBBE9
MSEQEELLAAVHHLVWPQTGDLQCGEAGHPAGHMCLAPSDETDLRELQRMLSGRYGEPRNLATGGFADPTVTPQTGLALLAPFGERVLEMRAWAQGGRWIGCGTARFDDGTRLVLLVAEREVMAVGMPDGTSWVEGIVAVTGWDTPRTRTVDWKAVEGLLGTALPGDYKQLVEIFGGGAFDGYLQLQIPGAGFRSGDLVLHAEWLADWQRTHHSGLWDPYEVYPTAGGLLEWAGTERADQFFWLTEGSDPDKWPVLITEDIPDSWVRFDGTAAEFIYRMLTDRRHPFSTARYFDTHWFQSYESED